MGEDEIDTYWYFEWPDYEREIRDRAEDGIEDDDEADEASEQAWQLAQETAAAMAGIVCWLLGGHLGPVVGYWPEDTVCPRCGYTVVSYTFEVDVVRQ